MKRITQEELNEVIRLHGLWEKGDPDGRRAVLDDHDLTGLNLNGASLNEALLNGASLNGASLNEASLNGASLNRAFLNEALLNGASLNRASLNGASLNGASLNRASLNEASLYRASLNEALLNGASLNGAFLSGVRGNMREIKSAHFDRWGVAWTMDPTRTAHLQIGCKCYPLQWWESATKDQISGLDRRALGWWEAYGAIVLALVKASPAVPWGVEL